MARYNDNETELLIQKNTTILKNQPYDEVVDLTELLTTRMSETGDEKMAEREEIDINKMPLSPLSTKTIPKSASMKPGSAEKAKKADDAASQYSQEEDEEEEDEDDDDADDDDEQEVPLEGHALSLHHIPRTSRPKTNPFKVRRAYVGHRPSHDAQLERNDAGSPYGSDDSQSLSCDDLSDSYFTRKGYWHTNFYFNVEEERDKLYSKLPYGRTKRAYDPADYEHLPVTSEIKELFQYITRYTPQNIELDHKLKPFIPDFIPAVGDIDAFIKVPRPDEKQDKLGLFVLDEPCAKQSDPTVLDLQLRAVTKETTRKTTILKTLQNADKCPKEIDAWIKSISDLHRSKPPPTVHYSRNMPDIDSLMQEWNPEFEALLKQVGLPSADLDCSLDEYVQIVCGLLDIPTYKSKIQSLHVLFTLYSEFKNSQHFKALAQQNRLENPSEALEVTPVSNNSNQSNQFVL